MGKFGDSFIFLIIVQNKINYLLKCLNLFLQQLVMEFCGAGSITDLVKGVEKLYFHWIIIVIVTVKIS